MDIEYEIKGHFVPETNKLVEELEADAVMLFVFGSRTKQRSGCCCEMRCTQENMAPIGWSMIECLRDMADAMERDLKAGRMRSVPVDGDYNEH